MNVVYTFKREATFLASSAAPAATATAASERDPAEPVDTPLFVLHTQSFSGNDSYQRTVVENTDKLASLHQGVLSFAHRVFRDSSSDRGGDQGQGANAVSLSAPFSSGTVDLEAEWPQTAPLAPTAVLSFALATLPLFRVIAADNGRQSTAALASSSLSGEGSVNHYFLYEYLKSRHFVFREPSPSEPSSSLRRPLTKADPLFYSTWDTFLVAVHAAVFDSSRAAGSQESRLCLKQYMERCAGASERHSRTGTNASYESNQSSLAATPGATPNPYTNTDHHRSSARELYSVSVWTEETLWRLLNALVSVLAVYHTAGFHFGGSICQEDVVCFALPSKLAGQLRETQRSMAAAMKATGRTHRSGEPGETVAGAESFMRTLTSSVVLPQLFIDAHTPSHRCLFALVRAPQSAFGGGRKGEEGEEPSPETVTLHQANDVRCVGRLLLAVVEARSRRLDNSAGDVSSEFLFLVRRMAAGETGSSPGALSSAVPSAVHLAQLQALRLRVHTWFYRLLEEENLQLAQMAHEAAREETPLLLQHQQQQQQSQEKAAAPAVRTRPSGELRADPITAAFPAGHNRAEQQQQQQQAAWSAEHASRLDTRERLLEEREQKLNAILELYELTHERLDALPSAQDAGYAQLRDHLRVGNGGVGGNAVPSTVADNAKAPPPPPHASSGGDLSVKESVPAAAAPAASHANYAQRSSSLKPEKTQEVLTERAEHRRVYQPETEPLGLLSASSSSPNRWQDVLAAGTTATFSVARPQFTPPSARQRMTNDGGEERRPAAMRQHVAGAAEATSPILVEITGSKDEDEHHLTPIRTRDGLFANSRSPLSTVQDGSEEQAGSTGLVTPKQPSVSPPSREKDPDSHSKYSSLPSGFLSPPKGSPPQRQRPQTSPRSSVRKADEGWIQHQYAALEALRATFELSSAAARPRSCSGSRGGTPPQKAQGLEQSRTEDRQAVPQVLSAGPGERGHGFTQASPRRAGGREEGATAAATAAYVPFFSTFQESRQMPSGRVGGSSPSSAALPTPWLAATPRGSAGAAAANGDRRGNVTGAASSARGGSDGVPSRLHSHDGTSPSPTGWPFAGAPTKEAAGFATPHKTDQSAAGHRTPTTAALRRSAPGVPPSQPLKYVTQQPFSLSPRTALMPSTRSSSRGGSYPTGRLSAGGGGATHSAAAAAMTTPVGDAFAGGRRTTTGAESQRSTTTTTLDLLKRLRNSAALAS